MKKKVISLIMLAVLLFTSSVPVFASTTTGKNNGSLANVMLVNTDDMYVMLNFYGDRAACVGVVHGKSGTTKITATALLKSVDGNVTTTVKAWTGLSAKGDTFYFDKSYYVASGHTYELEIDAKVYRNGKSEYVSLSDSKYCGG